MDKYTQGPWVVNGNQIHAANKHETFVAEVFDQNGDAKANARLIAAAPELLVALEFVLTPGRHLGCADNARLQALIKKAKGE
jgi:hypothetical protein